MAKAREYSPLDIFKQYLGRESTQGVLGRYPVDREDFNRDAIQLIEAKPNHLSVDDPESLIDALLECASYGFYPRGDEGYIEISNNKIGQNEWRRSARYELQLAGIRAIAAKNGIYINAVIVHENDHFEHDEGDEPRLAHHINWKHPDGRGNPLLVYAIFKHKSGVILHREVMDKVMIDDVRAQSRAKDSLMWTKFWDQGWKKSVIRRGSKAVRLSEDVNKAVCQVDRDYSFGASKERDPAPEPEAMVDVKATKSTRPEKVKSDAIDADAKEIVAPRKKAAVKKAAPKKTAKATPKPAEPEPIDEGPEDSAEDGRVPETQNNPGDGAPETTKDDDGGVAKQSKFTNLSADEAEALLDQLADQIDASETIDQLEALWKEHAEFIGSYDQDTVEWIAGMYEDNKARLSSE